jgi:sugar phosphate isomerase/epimerase
MTRRQFVTTASLATAGLALAPSAVRANTPRLDSKGQRIPLGMDNFAVRAFGWKGRELVDYAASLRLDTLFITDIPAFGTKDPTELGELRRYAQDKGVAIQSGSWSICPTSKSFKKDWGTAEEHLALCIRMAKAVGSPVARIVLGSREDRKTPGGIQARIEDTVAVLKSQRSLAIDSGVKIAIENHAGDMTATELVGLVEASGKDYVGVNLDSGNALWTLEDPIDSLEKLGPYALCTSLRDSAIWETEKGCKIQWTAMGEGGVVDLKRYFDRFAQLCPGVAVNIETIGGFAIEFPYLEASFWDAWPKKPAAEFANFLALAKRGHSIPQHDGGNKDLQKGELERSIRYCREVLGLGTKA